MTDANTHDPKKATIEDARDLLVRLYGEIRISALAAALEMARRPAPSDASSKPPRDVPGVLRDQDLAA